MGTYLIGDLQGCFDALESLLERVNFQPGRDRLLFTGDLVNRGGQDLPTLRFLYEHRDCVEAVLGNHDLHLLASAAGLRPPKARDTFQDILEAPDREPLLEWLLHRPLLLRRGELTLVHAGLLPEWSLDEAMELARALEDRLRTGGLAELISGPRFEGPWPPADAPTEDEARLRLALDALVSLRFLTPEGAIDRSLTCAPEEAPPGYLPWFEAPGRRSAGEHLVHGHWASLGVRLKSRLWSLDGGCVWGGFLCAIRLEDEARFEARRATPPSP